MTRQACIFTVDVEEYYHAENICRSIPAERLQALPDRVEIGVNKLLDLLARHDGRATFFVLGCVAEKHPALIKRITGAGHEIASHGHEHIPLHVHTRKTFDEDLGASVRVLSGITGRKVLGYRATSFSLGPGMEWFFEILAKNGIVYDSSLSISLFRKHHRELWRELRDTKKAGGIPEFPPSYIRLGPCTLPVGGGYFRAYPYWLTKHGLAQYVPDRWTPALFYIHPWELDPGQPRLGLPPMKYMRHYLGLAGAEGRLARLVAEFRCQSVAQFLGEAERQS